MKDPPNSWVSTSRPQPGCSQRKVRPGGPSRIASSRSLILVLLPEGGYAEVGVDYQVIRAGAWRPRGRVVPGRGVVLIVSSRDDAANTAIVTAPMVPPIMRPTIKQRSSIASPPDQE